MKHSTFVAISSILIVAFLLVAPLAVSSSRVAAAGEGFWRLDKVSTKNTDVPLQPGQNLTYADGSVSASADYVTHSSFGGDTTGTRQGTNTWDGPPLNLYPGISYTTTISATSSVTAQNGNASSTHETTLWLGSENKGSVRALSIADSGNVANNTGEVTESKTITWTIPAGSDGERYGVSIASDTCLGFTILYTYEYVWQSTAIGDLILTPTATPESNREITITGYDGSDTLHTPLTYLIQVKENGKPLANEPVFFQFSGDVTCLKNDYAIWDSGSKSWTAESANLANPESIQTTSDDKGQVTLRALLDLWRMHELNLRFPCAETLRVGVAKSPGDQQNLITAEATVTLRYPAYIQGVFFWSQQDPIFKPSRWVPIGVIETKYNVKQHVRQQTPYPPTDALLERVQLNGQTFRPPANDRAYFSPVSAGDELTIDLCNSSKHDPNMLPEDGIALSVIWMDGTQAMFAQRNQDDVSGCLLVAKFSAEDYRDVETNTPTGWVRFAVSQAGDVIIKASAVWAATATLGPLAGAWTAFWVDVVQTAGDIEDAYELGRVRRIVRFHSDVSITRAQDGLLTLYNFQGSPTVQDDTGVEVAPAPGEAVDFRITGPVSAPEKREPPAEAAGLRALIANEIGLSAPTFEELGFGEAETTTGGPNAVSPTTASPSTTNPAGESSLNMLWALVSCAAIFLAVGIGLFIGIGVLRQRSRPSNAAAAPAGTPLKGGNPRPLLLVGGGSIVCLACVALVAGMLAFSSPQPPVVSQVEEGILTPLPPTSGIAAAPQLPTSANPAPSAAPVGTQPVAEFPAQTFRDDFSNTSSGWPQLDNAQLLTGYSEGGMYGIGLKQAGAYADARIPHGIGLPLNDSSLYFRARPVAGKGFFGAVCDYADADNGVMIGVTEGAYLIARFVDGVPQYYLATPWVSDPAIKPENGEYQVQLDCGSTIQLMVNGYSVPAAQNPGRIPGDLALFGISSKNAALDGYLYYQVLFDDVEVKAK